MKKCLILTIACLAVNDAAVGMRGFSFSIGCRMGGERAGPFVGVGCRNGYWELNPGSFSQNRLPEDNNPQLRREREERAKSSFSNWIDGSTYSVTMINGEEYHVAQNSKKTFITLGRGRSWEKTSRGFIGYSRFYNQPSNIEFEETPLIWHFAIEVLGGRRYNHAWTDTMLDFLVPEGEKHRICAPSWYVELQQSERQKIAVEKAKKMAAEGYFEESIWSALNAKVAINRKEESRARDFASQALNYYERALDTLRPIGCFVDDVLEEFATPGGIENLQRYRNGEISTSEYNAAVNRDIASDMAAGALGALIGGATGGTAGALAGPGGVIAGANVGAFKGAAAGFVASRAYRAVARASVSFFKGGSGSNNERTQAVKEDADNYIDGIREKGVLSDKKIARDGREYFEIMKKFEYKGIKFKKGQFLERDTQHHEWEYFRNKDTHLGAIDPLTGKLDISKMDPARTLKVK